MYKYSQQSNKKIQPIENDAGWNFQLNSSVEIISISK